MKFMTTSLIPSFLQHGEEWAAEFRRGEESMEDYDQSGNPKEATTNKNVELVHSLILCDRRSLRDIARQIGISFGTVQVYHD